VNVQHLRAFLWLRWRLFINQFKRAGVGNLVALALLIPILLPLAPAMFVGFLLVGAFALAEASPAVVLYVWDGLVVTFLFCWCIGVLTELQRSEALSLEKFLHLPVSLRGVFLINYLSSLLSLNLLMFVPAMVGLTLGLALSKGLDMLLLFPLVAAFLLMVTAVTYHFQGWLASLMVNKRRRRTIIVVVTMSFVLLAQVPNLVNVMQPWKPQERIALNEQHAKDMSDLYQLLEKQKIEVGEYNQRQEKLKRVFQSQQKEMNQEIQRQVEWIAALVNLVLPPGWLPLGAESLAAGSVWPVLPCMMGMALIGTASLWRSYRTTLRMYTGQFTSGKKHAAAKMPAAVGTAAVGLLEKEIPWVSEPTAVIALASFRSLMRAPEAKMMLLSPIILVGVFGVLFLTNPTESLPEAVRPLVSFGGMAMVLFGMVQFVGNQFGFDRSGFRVFVLSAVPRRDILLGKNLAFAPVGLGMGLVVAVVVGVICPMRVDHFLASLVQLLSMYLLLCLLGNLQAILAPMPIAAGSMKPTSVKLIPVLLQMVFFFVIPMILAPTLLPLGIEVLLEWSEVIVGVPVCLILSVLLCLAIVFLYRLVLTWEGRLLQMREQRILEIVTTKAE
jgi:ABC-2 type transport system permease protein